MPFFSRGKTVLLLLHANKGKKQQKRTKKGRKNKRGGFRAKWGGPLGRLTWPLNPPKKETEKIKKTKKNTKKKKTKYPKMSFSVISQHFLCFLFCPNKPFFENLAQNARTPQKKPNIEVSENQVLKTVMCHETASLGPKNPNPEIPVIICFRLSLLIQQQKHQIMLNPYFIVNAIFRKLPDNWPKNNSTKW